MTADPAEARSSTLRVLGVRTVSPTSFVVSMERGRIRHTPGQCVLVGLPGHRERREYSIYSPRQSDALEILVREVPDGAVSRRLRRLRAGDPLAVDGPVGYFTLNEDGLARRRHLFIASGTGLAPFHSMVLSYPGLEYLILHGVRAVDDAFERDCYAPGRYVCCASRDPRGDFRGRVTDWLRAHPPAGGTLCFLCGNARMIDDAFDVLTGQGIAPAHIRAEVYF